MNEEMIRIRNLYESFDKLSMQVQVRLDVVFKSLENLESRIQALEKRKERNGPA